MKKLKNTLLLSSALLFIGNNSFAATEAADTTVSYTKYIAIGVAALIIILLLFLGYKMDSKGDKDDSYIVKKSSKKEKAPKRPVHEDVKYEADNINYENDIVSSNDLTENTEYEEDNEDSLFSTFENNDEIIDNPEEPLVTPKKTEEYGEEFDTSIIDNIEDDINSEEINEDVEIPLDIDETMVFNNPPASDFNINDIEKVETDFEGFSVASKSTKDEIEENKIEEVKEEKPRKKYTKSKKNNSSVEEDFLAQMEENLKKDKEKRNSKK